MEPIYQRAITITSPPRLVYAAHLKMMTMIYDDIFMAGNWIVWWTDKKIPLCQEFTPEEFNEMFVLESNVPARMADRFQGMPNYAEWVEFHNKVAGALQ